MKKGFTFVEVLLAVAIMGLLVGIITGTLDPIALVNKGNDARRKRDVAKIKIAMEEYYADKGCYPATSLVSSLNNRSNCSTDIFAPWISSWPCDPQSGAYYLIVEEASCPSWFKVIAHLANKKDRDILSWWYDYPLGTYVLGDGSLTNADVNWGLSSTNVLWYERTYPAHCYNTGQCQQLLGVDCQPASPDGQFCSGSNCYLDGSCSVECQVSCCRDGQPCE